MSSCLRYKFPSLPLRSKHVNVTQNKILRNLELQVQTIWVQISTLSLTVILDWLDHFYTPRACVLSRLSRVWLFATPWTVCNPPDFSVHGILQPRILQRVGFPSRGSSWPTDQTCVSCTFCIADGLFTTVLPGKPLCALQALISSIKRNNLEPTFL